MKLLLTFFLISVALYAKNIESTKQSCIQQSAYPNKTLAQQKKILIEQAKQESLEELYGALIFSSTDIKNGKLTDDSIQSRAVGAVRVKGNPKFENGKNLGEICANVTSYITPEDIKKYSPKEIQLKHFCFSDPKVAVAMIKPLAKRKAYIEAITQYRPSLKSISMDQAEKLVHGFKISNDNFDFSSGAYCFDAVATILPYELEFDKLPATKQKKAKKKKSSSYKKGILATFYAPNDFDYTKPLASEVLPNLNLTYKGFPSSEAIKVNVAYLIKIEGFVKAKERTTENIHLFADVYSAALYVDGEKIVDNKFRKGEVELKKGYSKIKLLLKSANRYDVRVVSETLNNLYY